MAESGGFQRAVESPPILAEAMGYFSDRGIHLRGVNGAPPGSRTTSRVAVRAEGRTARIGMFRPGTHDVVPCSEDQRCHVPHHPAINQAISLVARELERFSALSAYDESSGQGTLRYLQLSAERSTRSVQLVLVANAGTLREDPALEGFAAHLWAQHGGGGQELPALHSIWANLNPTTTNNILSYGPGAWRLLHSGDGGGSLAGSLTEGYPSGASFVLPPYVFRQANLDGFDAIVAEIREAVPAGARVVEWYAGVGALGLSLADGAEWIRCSDVNPPHDAFEASRALLPPSARDRVSYAVGSAGDRLDDANGADVAVVDPPRKGLDPSLLSALCDAGGHGPCASLRTLIHPATLLPCYPATLPTALLPCHPPPHPGAPRSAR